MSDYQVCGGLLTDLTQAIAKELVEYFPESGKLFWRKRSDKFFEAEWLAKRWNTRYSGAECFCSNHISGYKEGTILNQRLLSHRFIWFYMMGEWPNEIDHINRVRDDNRWENLRNVDRLTNAKNLSQRRDALLPNGIFWDKWRNRYSVSIGINGKSEKLGRFKTLEEAIDIRREAEKKYGYINN